MKQPNTSVSPILRSNPTNNPELMSLIDAVRDYVFFLDRWGLITHANAVACRWRSLDDMIGKNLVEVAVHWENPSENHREVMQVIRTGVPMTASEVHATVDGKDFWFRVDKIPTHDVSGSVNGIVLILNDISHHVTTKRALRESDARYKTFIDNSADAIWCYDLHPPVDTRLPVEVQVDQIILHSMLVECNERLVKLYEVDTAAQLMGRPIHMTSPMSSRMDIRQFIENNYLLESKEMSRVNRYGERTHLQISTTGVLEDGYLVRAWGSTRDITEQKRYIDKMEYLATHDALTNLPNRSLLYNRISEAIRHRSDYQTMALLLIDLDRFKEINDTLGHLAGDKLLKQLGPRLETELGQTPGLVSRLGGDEFAIFLPNIRNTQQGVVFAHRFLDCLTEVFEIEGIRTEISASIGISVCPDQANDVSTLMRYADVAMYHAKVQLTGVAIYDSEFDPHSPKRLELMGALGGAIRQNQLRLFFQPKVDLKQHCVYGVEALLRWSHPELGFVPPGEFIPIAELSSVIYPLTQWVVENAVNQCAEWYKCGIAITMSINISARNLTDERLVESLENLIARHQLPPELIELEITESAIMADPNRALGALERISALGIRLAVDDYGTGYSSLAYLKRLPVQTLKIDASFVLGMAEDPQDEIIVGSTINLSHNLGLEVVAEGVETAHLYDRLVEQGCDSAQGYFIGRPMPVEQINDWLAGSGWYKKKVGES